MSSGPGSLSSRVDERRTPTPKEEWAQSVVDISSCSEEERPEGCPGEEMMVTGEEDPGGHCDSAMATVEGECSDDRIREAFAEWIRYGELPKFGGTGAIAEARRFLLQLGLKYDEYQCSPAEGIMMIERSLMGNAKAWWRIARKYSERCFGGNVWGQFRAAFTEEYLCQEEETELVGVDPVGGESEGAVKEIQGWLEVNGRPAYALFDTGSTHSYVDENFVKESRLRIRKLRKAMGVQYADGRREAATHSCKRCSAVVDGVCTQISLTVHPVRPLDVLIGMDYMGAYHAHIDCRRGEIEFRVPGREAFTFRGERDEGRQRQKG